MKMIPQGHSGAHETRGTRRCVVCRSVFTPPKTNLQSLFCSRKCKRNNAGAKANLVLREAWLKHNKKFWSDVALYAIEKEHRLDDYGKDLRFLRIDLRRWNDRRIRMLISTLMEKRKASGFQRERVNSINRINRSKIGSGAGA